MNIGITKRKANNTIPLEDSSNIHNEYIKLPIIKMSKSDDGSKQKNKRSNYNLRKSNNSMRLSTNSVEAYGGQNRFSTHTGSH